MKAEDFPQKEDNLTQIIKNQLRIQNILFLGLLAAGLFGLGLFNWADFEFRWDRLTPAYFSQTAINVLCYGAIISSLSTYQLDKRKLTSEVLAKVANYITWVLTYYRPLVLKKYIYGENLETRKEAYIDKYKRKFEKLERKYKKMKWEVSWLKYQKEKVEALKDDAGALVEPPNKYCAKKERILERLDNVDKYLLVEYVKYPELKMKDLVSGIASRNTNKVPREREGIALSLGVMRGMVLMFVVSGLLTVLVWSYSGEQLDAIIKTIITIFLVFLCTIKGIVNGERVFNGVTLHKELFRRHHLHSYVMLEAGDGHVLPKEKETV